MYAFLDFEASSLSERSFPIEVGMSWLCGGEIETWSTLIRPSQNWQLDDWSAQSQEVHQIEQNELQRAPYASEVAAHIAPLLHRTECEVFSDYPSGETKWLNMLLQNLEAAPTVTVLDFDKLVGRLVPKNQRAWERIYRYLDRHPAPHRAGPDTARLAQAILHGFSA